MNKTICIIQDSFISAKSGGYEIQIYNLFHRLIARGWKVIYIAAGVERQEYEFNGFQVYTVPKRHYFSFFNPSISRILRNHSVAIVYQRSRTVFSTGNIGLRFAKKNNLKFVFSIGSPDDLVPMFLTRSLWKSPISLFKKSLASVDTLIKDFLFKRNFFLSDLIISQNDSQRAACKKEYHRDSVIIRSCHPVPPSGSYEKDTPVSVSWVANARTVKQPELFLELARQCEDLSKKLGVTFVMVMGKNIINYQNSAFMQSLTTQFNMTILGEKNIDEANDIMGRSSMLVNTSVYEGFSNTYIQAWMRETPVVTLQCDPDGVIEANRLGFHSKTFEQLVKDVRHLIENDKIRTQMGANARVFAMENHNIEKSADAMNDLLIKLIG